MRSASRTTVVVWAVVAAGVSQFHAHCPALGGEIRRVPSQYPTIQAGIDAANDHDTVLVADGDYLGPGNNDFTFRGKSITVQSETGHVQIDEYISSPGGVRFDSGESAEAVLDGFSIAFASPPVLTIINSSPTIRNCRFGVYDGWGPAATITDGGATISDTGFTGLEVTRGDGSFVRCGFGGHAYGYGLIMRDSNTRLTDCQISDNGFYCYESSAGGVLVQGGSTQFLRCEIRNNMATSDYGGNGAGLQVSNCNAYFGDCTFSSNVATSHLGMINGDGAGATVGSGKIEFRNCRFEHNSAGGSGGAVYCGGNVSFMNCAFEENDAEKWAGAIFGGGIFTDCRFVGNESYEAGGAATTSGSRFTRCTFIGNVTGGGYLESGGGAIRSWGSNTILDSLFVGNFAYGYDGDGGGLSCTGGDRIRGCTFVANTASGSGAGVYFDSADATMANCVVWGNDGVNQIDGEAPVAWSAVEGGYPGEGNIADDPRFVDPVNGDYHLGDASPCIDAGHNGLVPSRTKFDLDGQPRFAEDLGSPNIGRGVAPLVDMGCYEFPGRSTGLNLRLRTSCPDIGAVRFGWANATPDGNAAVLFAQTTGSVRIPNNRPCAGTHLDLSTTGLRIAWRGTNDHNGQRTINGMAPAGACGGFVQFIDLSTCAVSDAIQVQ